MRGIEHAEKRAGHSAGSRDYGRQVARGSCAHNMPIVQLGQAEENGPLPERQQEAGRAGVVLLALRVHGGRVLQ